MAQTMEKLSIAIPKLREKVTVKKLHKKQQFEGLNESEIMKEMIAIRETHLQDLREYQLNGEYISPYMIGMSYLRHIAHSGNLFLDDDNRKHDIKVVSDIDAILSKWDFRKRSWHEHSILAGQLYIEDYGHDVNYHIERKQLEKFGCMRIGKELWDPKDPKESWENVKFDEKKRGGAWFVWNNSARFLLSAQTVQQKNRPINQRCSMVELVAEHYNLWTLTYRQYEVPFIITTITAKNIDDITLIHDCLRHHKSTRDYQSMEPIQVIFAFGYSSMTSDKFLFRLAGDMEKLKVFKVLYFFIEREQAREDISYIIESDASWSSACQYHRDRKKMKFSNDRADKINWTFFVSACGVVNIWGSPEPHMAPYSITVPIGNKTSIEIVRKTENPKNLTVLGRYIDDFMRNPEMVGDKVEVPLEQNNPARVNYFCLGTEATYRNGFF